MSRVWGWGLKIRLQRFRATHTCAPVLKQTSRVGKLLKGENQQSWFQKQQEKTCVRMTSVDAQPLNRSLERSTPKL